MNGATPMKCYRQQLQIVKQETAFSLEKVVSYYIVGYNKMA